MRRLAVLGVALLALVSCGDDDGDDSLDTVASSEASSTTTTAGTTGATTGTSAASSSSAATEAATTTTDATTSTEPAEVQELAIWPAPDVVFADPAEAAGNFVEHVFDVPATLGEFREGDGADVGEIDVYSPGEGAYPEPNLRSTLHLRQLGPGWFVTGAVSDEASITEPETPIVVPAGPLTVAGEALGFEANVVVFAFPQGDAGGELDRVVTLAGSMFEPEPYSVDLDLSGAQPGSVVGIVTRGGSGLETDPGAFAAIAVEIEG